MSGLRLFVFASMAFSLFLSPTSFAADESQSIKVDETKSKDRGISFTNLAPSNVQAPANVQVTAPRNVDFKPAVKTTKTAVVNQKNNHNRAKTPILVAHPKSPEIAKEKPAINSVAT